jgi:glycosyltransferase involved in cell wall biosynthesis
MENSRYVIITPVRNEEKYLPGTIDSIREQTIPPAEWVIVDDGSIDSTGAIADRAASDCDWIHVVHREDRGFRKAGGGIIEAFYAGYDALQTRDFYFVVKLDGDLTFDSDYFANCFQRFADNEKLGIGGGVICNLDEETGELHPDHQPRFHVRGATKIYRRACWDVLGALVKAPGWDALDEVKANMLGWQTESFSDIRVAHHRITGKANGKWGAHVKDGIADYVAGYHPLFFTLKFAKRLARKPYLIHSAGLLYGFLSGYIREDISQVDDRRLIAYLRGQQMRRISFRKTIWK